MKTATILKSVDLREDSGGIHGEIKYYADNKRVTREQFQAIKASAVRLECISNAQINGAWSFYSVARTAS